MKKPDPAKPSIRYVIYARKSSEDDGRQVRSINDQIVECEELATRNGLNVIVLSGHPRGVIEESRSARRPNNRPEFDKMIAELRRPHDKRRFDAILAWHPNRLTRNAYESGLLIQMLDDDQITDLQFCSYIFHNDPSGKEHIAFEFARAKGYSDHLSVDIRRGMKRRYEEGALLQQAPFGYAKKMEDPKNTDRCSLLPIPDGKNFELVKIMFNMRQSGKTLETIALWLQTHGLKGKRGGETTPQWVYKILTNPFYYGFRAYNTQEDSKPVDYRLISRPDWEFVPAISEGDFYKIQRLDEKKTITALNLPLRGGLISCGYCESPMYPERVRKTTAKGVTYHGYYRCQNDECPHRSPTEKTKRGEQNSIGMQTIFDKIEEDLRQFFRLTDMRYAHYIQWVESFTLNEEEKQNERRRFIECKRRSAVKEHKGLALGRVTKKHTALSLEAIDVKIDELEKEIRGYDTVLVDEGQAESAYRITLQRFLELGKDLWKRWHLANDAQKHDFAGVFLLNCIVKDKELASVSYKEPFQTYRNEFILSNGGDKGNILEQTYRTITRLRIMPDCFDILLDDYRGVVTKTPSHPAF
jgi:DNA invertase Pin-like site-specific DNA recombinase